MDEKISEGRVFLVSRFLAKGIGRWTALCITGYSSDGI